MKSAFSLLYYIVFVGALWMLNRHFQAFVAINGILQGALVGLVLAFLAKLIFKTLTKMIMSLIIVVGLVIFLFSIEFFAIPDWLANILVLVQN